MFSVIYISLSFHLHKQLDSELLSKAKEFNSLYSEHGIKALRAEFQREARAKGVRRVFFQLLSNDGKILASSDTRHWNVLGKISFRNTLYSDNTPLFQTLSLPDRRHKVRIILIPTYNDRLLVLGSTLGDIELMLERYRETFGTALVLMLLCGTLLGWLLARKAMIGVQRVTQTAIQIKEGDLNKRVPPGREGLEIDNLAKAFNEMLDKIENLMNEIKEVTDNIAHDLRTPITRIRGFAETTLLKGTNLDEFKNMAAKTIEESDRLIEVINTMLEISKIRAGAVEIKKEQIDLKEIVLEAIDLFQPLAEDKNICIETNIPSHPIFTRGERAKLQRTIANLLDNAIKFTPSNGNISLSISEDRKHIELTISDTGIGIAAEELPRIFDKFYRSDRSRSTPGSGLGLSLARAIVEAHSGEIRVESTLGKGSKFTIILPSVSAQKQTPLT